MDRSRPTEAKAPPPGEWAVFHERPFPERLDRAFRLAAIVVAPIAGLGFGAWAFAVTSHTDSASLAIIAALALVAAALSYGFVRAVGMIVTSLYGFTQRKQYVLDWHEPPPGRR